VRQTYRLGDRSLITQDVVFHADSTQIDFETLVDWDEQHQLLQVAFDLGVRADYARHEIQFGHLMRPTHTNRFDDRARFEAPVHKWSDISEPGYGIALLNDGRYGTDIQGQQWHLTLLSAASQPDPRYDAGQHRITYSVLPHSGGFSVPGVVRPAYELNASVMTQLTDKAAEALESPFVVEAGNVVVEWLKWAEEDDGLIIRLYEAAQSATQTRLCFNMAVNSVVEVDMLEENPQPLEVADNGVTLDLRPFEIKTLRVA
jgi:alpha-mannosidase